MGATYFFEIQFKKLFLHFTITTDQLFINHTYRIEN